MKISACKYPACLTLLALLMFSCAEPNTVTNTTPLPSFTIPPSVALFDPTSGNPADIPLPNDILRDPATGVNSVPIAGEPFDSLNTLSGFSTSSSIVLPFFGDLNPDTVNNDNILVINLSTLEATPFTFNMVFDEANYATAVLGTPVKPLNPATRYMVVVTDNVAGQTVPDPVQPAGLTVLLKGDLPFVDAEGHSTRPTFLNDEAAAQLEPLRQSYQQLWQAAESITGQSRYEMPLVFAFTTQPLFDTVTALRERAQAERPSPTITRAFPNNNTVRLFYNINGLGAVPNSNIGALYIGSFNAPNYIQDPLNGPFVGSGRDVAEASRENIEFIVFLPEEREGPVPVLIYQHGITAFKETAMIFADAACENGVAVIAIDLVLHGSRAKDLINNQTGAIGPDGRPDPSGSNFINLANLRVGRDNIRQSVSDLHVLTRMITTGATDFTGDGNADLLPLGITFIGMSLGGIVGTPFLATEPAVTLGALNVPGGRIGSLLQNSPALGPSINAGLQAFGIQPGTPDYLLFFLVAQTLVDDADAFNYAPHMFSGSLAGGSGTQILIQEMLGDTVVPNSATEDLARAMGIAQVNAIEPIAGLQQVSAPYFGSGLYQFNNGGHSFLLDPSQGPTVEGLTQIANFLLSGLLFGNPVVIDPFAPAKYALHFTEQPKAETVEILERIHSRIKVDVGTGLSQELDTKHLVYTGVDPKPQEENAEQQ